MSGLAGVVAIRHGAATPQLDCCHVASGSPQQHAVIPAYVIGTNAAFFATAAQEAYRESPIDEKQQVVRR
jgi:hypothetical protein